MTIYEAEERKAAIEKKLLEKGLNLQTLNVLIAPAGEHFFQSFQKQWRNSNYVVALQNYAHCEMSLYVEDVLQPQAALQPIEIYLNSQGIDLMV